MLLPVAIIIPALLGSSVTSGIYTSIDEEARVVTKKITVDDYKIDASSIYLQGYIIQKNIEQIEILRHFASEILENQIDLTAEFEDIINKKFWDLL